MPDHIYIRDLRAAQDIHAVEDLQRKIWGMSDLDILPSTMIIAAIEAGGILVGAFLDDYLAGFAFAFPGIENGLPTMHSDMLGVDPAYRNHDLGCKLKLAQRDRAIAAGISRITWTFDPLQSLNAYFNISKLGAISDKYKVDFYGETSSFLHRLGTDRLWVRWLLHSNRVTNRLNDSEQCKDPASLFDEGCFLVQTSDDLSPKINEAEVANKKNLLIEIPGDINSIMRDNLPVALRWRESVRWAFTTAFAAGFVAEDFFRFNRQSQSTGVYLLKPGHSI